MAVLIGSARISENNTSGWDGKAKAGDQTGREVSTQNWYLHSKGWVVLRPKDKAVAEKVALNMQYATDNRHIGYDQSQRDTLYHLAKEVGFDCSKVKQDCETDCSALVRVCVNFAGVPVGNFRTATEAEVLMKTGAFQKLTAKKYTESSDWLQRGDILVTKSTGHTVVVLTDGAKVAKIKEEPHQKSAVTASRGAHSKDKYLAGTYKTTGRLNLRDGAGLDYKVLHVIPNNHKVKCYGYYTKVQSTVWMYVQTEIDGVEYIGFCSERYLRRV